MLKLVDEICWGERFLQHLIIPPLPLLSIAFITKGIRRATVDSLTQVTKGHTTSIGTSHSHVPPDKEAVRRTHHLFWEILTENARPKFNFEDISVHFKTTVLNFKSDKSQLSREGQQGRDFCLAVNNLNPKRLPCPKPLCSVRCL